MKFFSMSELLNKAKLAFERFPFALLWAIISTITTIILVEIDADSIFKQYVNLSITMVLGISWLIATQFYIEQFKKKNLWWIKVIVLLAIIGSYFLLPEYDTESHHYSNDDVPYIRYVLFLVAGHLALFFAPFITVWHPKAYWNYLMDMFIAISRSGFFSGILYIGLVIAMTAVRALFDIHIEDQRYGQLFLLCLGIVNTWVYLSDFPKEIQHNIHLEFNKAIEVLVKFILIPLTLLYLAILYAYVAKIIIQWELPKGWVSYLISALALLLFAIQFIIHPVRLTHKSRLIRKFTTYAFWLLLPLLILLYIAIYTRVAAYGITELRYFLIIVAIFITGSTLYFLFSKRKQLRFLPLALAIFALIGSFGFWGAFSVSKRSQVGQLKELYSAFNQTDSIAQDDKNRFESITNYLYDRDALEKLTPIIGFNPKKSFPSVGRWQMGDKILDSLGFQFESGLTSSYSNYHNFNVDSKNSTRTIEGYDYMDYTQFYHYKNKEKIGFRYELNEDNNSIEITNKEGDNVLKIELQEFIENLNKNNVDEYHQELAPELLSIEAATDSLSFKVLFENINYYEEDSVLRLNGGQAFILYKKLE